MISSDLTYQAGLERIDDLRRQAEDLRLVSLARSQPDEACCAAGSERRRPRRQRSLRPALSGFRPRRAARA